MLRHDSPMKSHPSTHFLLEAPFALHYTGGMRSSSPQAFCAVRHGLISLLTARGALGNLVTMFGAFWGVAWAFQIAYHALRIVVHSAISNSF